MNYIIDGHNLISKLDGIDLSMPDDEEQLIELLSAFCRQGRHHVEVYFDGAPLGQAGVRGFGRVRAHFVPQSQEADDAIRRRLESLGRAAKNWTVVSSDRSVLAAGNEAHAMVVSAEEFAREVQGKLHASSWTGEKLEADQPLSEAEVKQWEEIFKHRRPKQP